MTNYKILVNKENKIEDSYYEKVIKPSIVPVESVKDNDLVYRTFKIEDRKTYLEKVTAEKFSQLWDYAQSNGITLGITSGFLTYEQQQFKYDYFLSRHGEEFVAKSVCLPGYSEHNTGLAMDCDIFRNGKWSGIALGENGETNDETNWLHSVLHKFGFILRYPAGKEHITKMKFEPWHIRYVEEELANYIYENKITLEEYFQQDKA